MAGMSHYYAHVVQMTKMLKQLVLWMDKAETHAAAKKFDVSVLLYARLAPDMYSLRRQIQNACDGPKFLAARLAGTPPPKHEDGEQSWSELRARASSVIEYLSTFKEASFAVSFMPRKGLRAIDCLTEMNLPNTYFHLSMTYAILRHNGVDVGKMDFLGSLAFRDL
jgi:hypothetical protein